MFKCSFLSSGFRSVPLKNGYNEIIELASLLVYVNVQQAEVTGHTYTDTVDEMYWLHTCMYGRVCDSWYSHCCHSELGGGAVLVLRPVEEEAGGAQQWTFPVQHTHQHPACPPHLPTPSNHERTQHQRETQVKPQTHWIWRVSDVSQLDVCWSLIVFLLFFCFPERKVNKHQWVLILKTPRILACASSPSLQETLTRKFISNLDFIQQCFRGPLNKYLPTGGSCFWCFLFDFLSAALQKNYWDEHGPRKNPNNCWIQDFLVLLSLTL